MRIAVKNMVCDRCIKVVKNELLKNDIEFSSVDLGFIRFPHVVSEVTKENLRGILKKEGFELIEDSETIVVNQIKSLIIESIHSQKEKPPDQNFSDFISSNMGMGYSYLSKLFSEVEGKTIEHFTIAQRIERAKELLFYNELTLSQISYELGYSSPQHLSRQFKQLTGSTPTEHKKMGRRKKIDTI